MDNVVFLRSWVDDNIIVQTSGGQGAGQLDIPPSAEYIAKVPKSQCKHFRDNSAQPCLYVISIIYLFARTRWGHDLAANPVDNSLLSAVCGMWTYSSTLSDLVSKISFEPVGIDGSAVALTGIPSS